MEKLLPKSSHPWLVRAVDISTKNHKVLFTKAYESEMEAEYVGVEVQNRLSNVEGTVITEIVDRQEDEVWETFSFYNANKREKLTDIENGTFEIPQNLQQGEMLWLISNPTESLVKYRAEKARELKAQEALKAKNSKKRKIR